MQSTLTLLLSTLWLFAMLLLPGCACLRRTRVAEDPHAWVQAIAWSLLVLSGLTAVLAGFGWLDWTSMGLSLALAAVLGLPTALPWLHKHALSHWLTVVLLLILALPWARSALDEGLRPAHTMQWYYWNLAAQMADAGGVPQWSEEFGMRVRWLPDYLYFHGASVGYGGALQSLEPGRVLASWRFPVALLGIFTLYAVLRLWMRRWSSLAGVALCTTTLLFARKFNAYKPEALGLVLGLLAVWLIVTGLRQRRYGLLLLAGATLGANISVHAIAATVSALFAIAAAVVEALARPRGEWRGAFGALSAGAVLGLVIIVATGWSLQGRFLVASDAMKPEMVAGTDATWEFLQLDSGRARPASKMELERQWERSTLRLLRPWRTFDLREPPGMIAAAAILLGLLLLALRGDPTARRGLLAILGWLALLTAAAAFFALAFDTYVPRNTGLSRIAQYMPLIIGLLGTLALQGASTAFPHRASHAPSILSKGLSGLVVGSALAFAVWMALGPNYRGGRIAPVAHQAWSFIARHKRPGDVLLQNARTAGTAEFFAGVEVPFAGRQPLIENPAFLARVNDTYRAAYAYFSAPRRSRQPPDLLRRLRPRWLLIAEKPTVLGSGLSFGGVPNDFQRLPYLEPVWKRSQITIYETRGLEQPSAARPGFIDRWWQALLAILLVLLLSFALSRYTRWLQPQPTT